MADEVTLTSRFGFFTFARDVNLSHAQLIRDTVTGQFFCPKPGERKIQTEDDVHQFMVRHPSSILAEIPFAVCMDVKPPIKTYL